eukprot:m.201285 g.201285  ORF g.201285 m.201285 type:complete len:590 (+) comp18800_c0_seq2:469-2238(+)
MASRSPEFHGGTPSKTSQFKRANTVSSSQPLKHKDKTIAKDTRERFQCLDLEVLLSEFKTVAHEKESDGEGGDDDDDDDASSVAVAEDDRVQWLRDVGLSSLVEIYTKGDVISDEHIQRATRGFMPTQVNSVRTRVRALNKTVGASAAGGSDGSHSASADNCTASKKSPSKLQQISEESGDSKEDSVKRLGALADSESEDFPTSFDDLSVDDQKQVQHLHLVHLTTLLESKKLFKNGKKSKKAKGAKGSSSTFGCNLETLVARDMRTNRSKMTDCNVPIIMSSIIDFLSRRGLHEEGIFRKAGSSARIKALRERIESLGGIIDFEAEKSRPHDVAALLKQFLRDTPEPLLTSRYLETFYITESLNDSTQQLEALQMLAVLLPPVHRACLRVLLRFLALVAANDGKNKMGIANLAVVFAPSLFYIRGHKGQKMLKEVELQVHTAATLRRLLDNQHLLFHIPPYIMAQLRYVREQQRDGRKASNAKDVKKLIRKRRGSESDASGGCGILPPGNHIAPSVKIALRLPAGSTREVEVTEVSTAESVLRSIGASSSDHYLLEKGGNIGSRRLHPRTRVFAVLKVNPDATLVVCK